MAKKNSRTQTQLTAASKNATKREFGAQKTPFPLSREDFLASEPITTTIGGEEVTLTPREFASGSLGYNVSVKVTLEVAGERVKFQVGGNFVAVNSKEAK